MPFRTKRATSNDVALLISECSRQIRTVDLGIRSPLLYLTKLMERDTGDDPNPNNALKQM